MGQSPDQSTAQQAPIQAPGGDFWANLVEALG